VGIPALFQSEALHGFMAYRSTSFPQALGLASTWDPALVKEVFAAAGDEMASSGNNQAFTPVLDLAPDPRWGRSEETYGEASRMGVAAIAGTRAHTPYRPAPRSGHRKTFCRARSAGKRHKHGSGKLFGARFAGILPGSL